MEDSGLSELRYEDGDLRITLRTASFVPRVAAAPAAAYSTAPQAVEMTLSAAIRKTSTGNEAETFILNLLQRYDRVQSCCLPRGIKARNDPDHARNHDGQPRVERRDRHCHGQQITDKRSCTER